MATDQAEVAPEVFLDALAWPAPATAPRPVAAVARRHRRRTASLLTSAGLVVVAGVLVGHALSGGPAPAEATLAALDSPQRTADMLSDDDAARLVVQPGSTRLLVTTDRGAYYAARAASGDLCLVRVPSGDLPSEVCVPDRVGADATIGAPGEGQVRLVADGATPPAAGDGWRPAGPNVWVRG